MPLPTIPVKLGSPLGVALTGLTIVGAVTTAKYVTLFGHAFAAGVAFVAKNDRPATLEERHEITERLLKKYLR